MTNPREMVRARRLQALRERLINRARPAPGRSRFMLSHDVPNRESGPRPVI